MKDPEEARRYAKEVREWRKAHGFCTRCGKEKAEKGKSLCLICKMDEREKRREKYANMPEEKKKEHLEEKREKAELIRKEKKANGICLQCSRPVYKNHSYCYEHYISQKKADKRHRKKIYPYHPTGVCRICGKEPAPGHKLCPEHYEQYAARMRECNKSKGRC